MSWSLMKTLQFFGFIAFALAIAFLEDYFVHSNKVEAQSPQRFQLQAEESFTGWSNMQVICDTATGTLIYRTTRGGLWGNPNGCAKNPVK